MINASDAARNVINYKLEQYQKVATIVEKMLPDISSVIEHHSKNGGDTAVFYFYTSSHFPTSESRYTAAKIFDQIFRDHGYKILQNDVAENICEIQW